MVKQEMISAPFQAILFTVITWNPESTVRVERSVIPYSTEIHRRDQGNEYIVGCNAGENMDIHWNVDGDRELSDTWTGFTSLTKFLKKKKTHQMDIPGPGRD